MCLLRLLFLPFIMIGRLAALVFRLTGCLLAFILGGICILIGFGLSVTLVGAIIGIPLIALGVSLIFNGVL